MNVGSSVLNNCRVLLGDDEESIHVRGQEIYRDYLYLLLSFAVSLKCSKKRNLIKKEINTEANRRGTLCWVACGYSVSLGEV